MLIRNLVGRATLVAAALVLVASNANADAPSIHDATLAEANQKTADISTEELRRILADRSATVLDTRTRAEFDAGHIPGARNIEAPPTGQVAAIEQMLNGNRGQPLVLYCNGPYCQASRRLADQLVAAGFTNVRRYQLGIPIWRALGGPIEIELGGIARVFRLDQTAVFLDARSAHEFAKRSLPGAQNAPVDDLISGRLAKIPLPEDDFNRRVILFGRDAAQARHLADALSKRPWHNVAYFAGPFEVLAARVGAK